MAFCNCSVPADGPGKWDKKHLRWALANAPSLANIAQRNFRKVANVCGLTFAQTQDERRADIVIALAEIDGPRGTLGQAWYPIPTSPNAGLILLDKDEDWRVTGKLEHVLLHEIGHSLGLTHSHDVNSVMFPEAVRPYEQDWAQTDVANLRRLYGKPPSKVAPKSSFWAWFISLFRR